MRVFHQPAKPVRAGGSRRGSPLKASPLPGSCRASPYPHLASSAAADWLAHGRPREPRPTIHYHGLGLPHSRGCRVGGGAHRRWPPSAAQTARTVFPYAAFTKTPDAETREKATVEWTFVAPVRLIRVTSILGR